MNCTATLNKGFSDRTKKDYFYISFVVNGKEISRTFIKETEIMYYENLLK